MKIAILCFIFVAAQASALNEIHRDSKVPSTATIEEIKKNMVVIENKNYYIGTTPLLGWKDAMRFCGDLGMTLVSLETQEKYEMIYNYLETETGLPTAIYWTSGVKVEEDWVWTTRGTEITYFNWATGEPTLIPQELCMFLTVNADNGHMSDAWCKSPQRFVCEFVC